MSLNRRHYAAAVQDALRLFGSDTAHADHIRERTRGEMSGKVATTARVQLGKAFGQLLEHATPAHLAALKARGHGLVLDNAVQDLSLAQLRRMHQRHIGRLKRDAVQLDVQRALRQHIEQLPSRDSASHRPPSFTSSHEDAAQDVLRKLRKRVGDVAMAMAPTQDTHQWQPVKGKPGRRKRRLPSGRWHYEDEPLQKADETAGAYARRLIDWHLGQIEDLHKGMFGPSHERVARNMVKLGAEVKRLAGQFSRPKKPPQPGKLPKPRKPKAPGAPKTPKLPHTTGLDTKAVASEEAQS